MEIHIREGLLMNGTSAMSGIGMLNVIYAENLMNWSLLASATIMELDKSFDDHYSTPLNRSKTSLWTKCICKCFTRNIKKTVN